MTGTPSPRDTACAGGFLRLTTAWGGTGRWSGRSPRMASPGLLRETGDHKALSGLRGSVRLSWRGEEPLRSHACLRPPALSPAGGRNPDQSDGGAVSRWSRL